MKTFFTLLFGGLMTVSAFASDVTLTFSGNKNYQVLIDGRSIDLSTYYANNTIRLTNLRPGQHSIQVYKIRGNRRNGNNEAYSSTFIIRPQYDLFINIDRRGRMQMDERRTYGYNKNNDNCDNGEHGSNDHDDDNYRKNNGYDNTYGGGSNRYSSAIDEVRFNQLVQSIRSQWFGKMSKARNALANNYFTTYQVKQILQIFSSENDKLELAKNAYKNTVDKQNFRQLYDLFSYNAQADLDHYIRDFR